MEVSFCEQKELGKLGWRHRISQVLDEGVVGVPKCFDFLLLLENVLGALVYFLAFGCHRLPFLFEIPLVSLDKVMQLLHLTPPALTLLVPVRTKHLPLVDCAPLDVSVYVGQVAVDHALVEDIENGPPLAP